MIVRVGKVTNVYPSKGKVKVYYEDLDSTSVELPMLTFNDEYKMPIVGDMVLTLHMQNGSSKGFVLGTYWNQKKTPSESSVGVYRKDLGGGAYIRCDASSLRIYAPEIIFQSAAGAVNLETIIALLDRVSRLEDAVSKLSGGES